MNKQTEQIQLKAKKIFITLLVVSLFMLAVAVTGIVFSFVYIEYLGLYQSLIVGGAVLIILVLTVFTTLWYNKAYSRK